MGKTKVKITKKVDTSKPSAVKPDSAGGDITVPVKDILKIKIKT